MSSLGPLEAETCRDYVVPRLREAGWSDDQIVEQYRITDGRVIPTRGRHRRGDPLKADCVLEIAPGFPIAVVEAKREYKKPADGLGQAIRYAMLLDLPLAYSTNGLGIVERDFDTGLEDDTLASFPSPSEAWLRYRRWKGFGVDAESTLLLPFARDLRNPDGSVKTPRYYQRIAIERSRRSSPAGRAFCSPWRPAPARRSWHSRSRGSYGAATGPPVASREFSIWRTATSSSTSRWSASSGRSSATRCGSSRAKRARAGRSTSASTRRWPTVASCRGSTVSSHPTSSTSSSLTNAIEAAQTRSRRGARSSTTSPAPRNSG